MAQRLALIVLTLAVAFPGSALALGLGEITLDSALGERMDARIELVSVTEQEAASLEVTLASTETFERYGLERSYVAGRLDFSVEQDQRGRYYIQVTSDEAIREPFVSFLIEVRWPSGRLLREYTVLVDPPTFMEEPAEAEPTRPTRTPTTTAPQTREETRGDRVQVPDEPARQAATPSRTASRPAPVGPGGSYGPVQRGQTLWGIANELRPDRGISVNQMMIALYRANPEAFQGNINRLKQGYVLRVPELDDIRAMTQREANNTVRDHNQRWRGGSGTAVADAGAGESDSARLSLVAPEGAGSTGASGGQPDAELQAEVQRLREELRRAESTSGALSEEVATLRQDVEEAERLLQVKDGQLAQLQQQLREEGVEVDTVPDEPFEPFREDSAPAEDAAGDTGEMAAEEGAAGPEGDAAAQDQTEEPTQESAQESADPASADAEADQAAGGETAEDSGAADQAEQEQPDRRTSAPVVRRPEPSLMDTVLDTLTRPLVLGGVVGVLILLIGGVVGIRKIRARKSAEPSTPDWAAGEPDEAEMPTEIAEVPGAEEVGGEPASSSAAAGYAETQRLDEDEVEEAAADAEKTVVMDRPEPGSEDSGEMESEADQFAETMAGGTPINLDDSDPTSEADFHMAYGLYDQAADLMNKAVEQHPDRKDFKVKLLEVYFVWGNKDDFVTQAKAFQDDLAGSSDWDNVVIMGKQIAPDEEMFTAAATGGGEAAVDLDFGGEEASGESTAAGSDLDIFGDDTGAGEAEAPAEPAPAPAQDEGDLEFDLGDLGGGDEPAAEAPAEEPAPSADAGQDDDMGLDIDLGLGDDSGAEEAPAEAPAEPAEAQSEGSDDQTMDLSEEDLGAALGEAEESTSDAGGEYDLSDFETGGDEAEPEAPAEPAAEEPAAAAEDELSFDLDSLDTGGGEEQAAEPAPEPAADEAATGGTTEGPTEGPTEGEDGEDSQNEFDKALDELSAFVDTNVEDEEEEGKGEDSIFGEQSEDSVGEMDFSLDESEDQGEASVSEATSSETLSDASWTGTGESTEDESGGSGDGEDEAWDDVGTKLDLARAYIDMGDPDGARSILEEVVSEGDEQQRKDAEELLGQVS